MKLIDFMDKYCVNIAKFSKKYKIAQNTIYGAIKGSSVHLKTAHTIEKVTGGQVTMQDLIGKDQDHKSQKKTNKKEKNDPTL